MRVKVFFIGAFVVLNFILFSSFVLFKSGSTSSATSLVNNGLSLLQQKHAEIVNTIQQQTQVGAAGNNWNQVDIDKRKALLVQILEKYPNNEDLKKVAQANSIDQLKTKFKPFVEPEKKEEKVEEIKEEEKPLRARIVTIATNDTIDEIRAFIGNLHHLSTPDNEWMPTQASNANKDDKLTKIQVTIYGLKLAPQYQQEIRNFKNVHYIDATEFVKSEPIKDTLEHKIYPIEYKLDLWRPFLLKIAVEYYARIIYFDSSVLLKSINALNEMEQELEAVGSVFITRGSNAEPKIVPNEESCDLPKIQGYKLGSMAYKHFLLPLVNCAYRVCSKDELKVLDPTYQSKITSYGSGSASGDQNEYMSLTCKPKFAKSFSTYEKLSSTGQAEPQQCHIIHTDQLIFSSQQLPRTPLLSSQDKSNSKRFAILIPLTSKFDKNLETTPLKNLITETILTVAAKEDKAHNAQVEVYFGYEGYDKFYETKEVKQALHSYFQGKVKIFLVQVQASNMWHVYMYNALYQAAILNGAHYALTLPVDGIVTTSTSADGAFLSQFAKILQQKNSKPDIGAVILSSKSGGSNAEDIYSVMVSNQHYIIFGALYPSNLHSEITGNQWIQQVYGLSNAKTSAHVVVTRAHAVEESPCGQIEERRLKYALEHGKNLLNQYLAQK